MKECCACVSEVKGVVSLLPPLSHRPSCAFCSPRRLRSRLVRAALAPEAAGVRLFRVPLS